MPVLPGTQPETVLGAAYHTHIWCKNATHGVVAGQQGRSPHQERKWGDLT